MPDNFLYKDLNSAIQWGFLKIEIPDWLRENLNPKFELRPYQEEAFARFFHCLDNDFPGKEHPLHLLFNMATGSGKTLIMAGLILSLYDKGYRNFLFFVNSTDIIEKTKDNFLNPLSAKYLFNDPIHIGGDQVSVTPVTNFEGANDKDINICFTTIQKLHSDLTTQRENAITFEDFRKHRVILIADEAHHMNVSTRSQRELFESWENTVERIFHQNRSNLLLEFTATHDYETPAMVEKYRNKVINRYDLLHFRNDGFSKDVVIVQSDFDFNQRILQALILSQYKREVAAKDDYRINLKPVILFKAQRTITQSIENKANFHRLIDELTAEQVRNIRRSNIPAVKSAFEFFDTEGTTDDELAERLKREFHEDYCLSVNNKNERETYQMLVNTLEDRNNRIRVVFVVKKLTEGWDVLNLFDIVRCNESLNSQTSGMAETTTSDAQLIGRGARYFPFVLPGNDERYRRKFDGNVEHELRIIEELHYHSINDSDYIRNLRTQLIKEGMMDSEEARCEIKVKDQFKRTDFYKYGVIWLNDRLPKDYHHVNSFDDLGVTRRNHVHRIATGQGDAQAVFDADGQTPVVHDENRRDVKIGNLGRNIVQAAIARNPFFTFASLHRYFPHLTSIREFITSEAYLGGLEITFEGNLYGLDENPDEKRIAVSGLIGEIESEVREQTTDYEGTKEFRQEWVREVFKDKVLKFDANNLRAEDDAQFEHFVSTRDWFANNTIYGTSEERAFVRMLDRFIIQLEEQYDEIYLLRNEGHFAIYNFSDGNAFQPDFALFLREKNEEMSVYQLFVEPKGDYLKEHDQWKEDFLRKITSEFEGRRLEFNNKKFRLIGVPFYNNQDENEFRQALESVLSLEDAT
jgi:type III restriction enzyme